MNEHLQELKLGGRPMTKLELANKEIERLNNIINEFEDILKRDIKTCNNKFENMFDRNYRRLILEEKLEQLQELKGSDKE